MPTSPSKRRAIIALMLSPLAVFGQERKKQDKETSSDSNQFFVQTGPPVNQPLLYLNLNKADADSIAVEIEALGRTVRLTVQEVLDALDPPQNENDSIMSNQG